MGATPAEDCLCQVQLDTSIYIGRYKRQSVFSGAWRRRSWLGHVCSHACPQLPTARKSWSSLKR